MDKKKSDIEGFDYPELDLSDEQPQNEQNDVESSGDPTKKIKIDQSIQKTNQVQNKNNINQKQTFNPKPAFRTTLPFFPPPPGAPNKGMNVWVPPPPTVQKTSQNQPVYNRPQFQKNQYPQSRDSREKKNTVYVKNIPRSFNTQEKLMTFFKNEGVIKQIKVNQAEQSAVIRFVKQQNAHKFLKSNKIIFNRSYIVYGENENLLVTQQQITDRMNDEMGNVKKAQKTNLKVLREKVCNELAENIRALYFLQNQLNGNEENQINDLRKEVSKEIEQKVEIKKLLQTENNEDFKPELYNTSGYNWTLSFIKSSNSGIDKKVLYSQFLKYGPLITIQYECLNQKPFQNQPQNVNQLQQVQKPLLDYRIRVQFLSPKHAWILYNCKKEVMGLQVAGDQIRRLFESGKLKTIQVKKSQSEADGGPQSIAHQKTKSQSETVLKPDESKLGDNLSMKEALNQPVMNNSYEKVIE